MRPPATTRVHFNRAGVHFNRVSSISFVFMTFCLPDSLYNKIREIKSGYRLLILKILHLIQLSSRKKYIFTDF